MHTYMHRSHIRSLIHHKELYSASSKGTTLQDPIPKSGSHDPDPKMDAYAYLHTHIQTWT